jgi:hypothetical protein
MHSADVDGGEDFVGVFEALPLGLELGGKDDTNVIDFEELDTISCIQAFAGSEL